MINRAIATHPRLITGISVLVIAIMLPLFVQGRITLWSTILESQLSNLDIILVTVLLGIYLLVLLTLPLALKNEKSSRQSSKSCKSLAEYRESYSVNGEAQDSGNQFPSQEEYNQECSSSDKPSHGVTIAGEKRGVNHNIPRDKGVNL